MNEMGKRLRLLRQSIQTSQSKLAAMFGTTQSCINRYENGQATPPSELLVRYADTFDVSLDYIFGRTDQPEGKLYHNKPTTIPENTDMRRFIEMCFEPGTPAAAKLKESLFRLMEEET